MIDREWPHQVAITAELCIGQNNVMIHFFGTCRYARAAAHFSRHDDGDMLLARTGREPKGIVINSGDVAKEMIRSDDGIAFFKAFPLWLCQYGPTPKLPRAWNRFTFWQYTETGKIDGMAPDGHVDLNYFNDGIGDLASAWTGKPPPSFD